jgi:hypothetical protein
MVPAASAPLYSHQLRKTKWLMRLNLLPNSPAQSAEYACFVTYGLRSKTLNY